MKDGPSLRDEFAGRAMQTFLAIEKETGFPTIARWAYAAADAMLEARDRKPEPPIEERAK